MTQRLWSPNHAIKEAKVTPPIGTYIPPRPKSRREAFLTDPEVVDPEKPSTAARTVMPAVRLEDARPIYKEIARDYRRDIGRATFRPNMLWGLPIGLGAAGLGWLAGMPLKKALLRLGLPAGLATAGVQGYRNYSAWAPFLKAIRNSRTKYVNDAVTNFQTAQRELDAYGQKERLARESAGQEANIHAERGRDGR